MLQSLTKKDIIGLKKDDALIKSYERVLFEALSGE